MGFNAFNPGAGLPDGNYCLRTIARPPYCIDSPTAAPKGGPGSGPVKPNGNPFSPNVGNGNGKTTWFNQGKPVSPGTGNGAAGPNTGVRPGNAGPKAFKQIENSAARHTVFTISNLVLLAITAKLL